MAIEVRKVSYSWDSVMEQAGLPSYRLDCFVWKDGVVVDEHRSFTTRKAFFQAMEACLPLLDELGAPQATEAV